MHVRAYAKFNPFLNIEGSMKNGYHDLSIIFKPVSIYDELFIEINKKADGVKLTCNILEFAGDNNIIHKAYKALKSKYKNIPGFNVHLIKNIPSGAGMGGGSSDASAFMVAVNSMMNLGLSFDKLAKMGAKIGADVPACIYRVPTLGSGIGDKLKEISAPSKTYYIVVKPEVSFNTAEMYHKYDELVAEKKIKTDNNPKRILRAISKGDIKSESKNYYNVFERVVPERNLILKIKRELISCGALGAVMTGSGSCVFGAFDTKASRDKALKLMRKRVSHQLFACEDIYEKERETHYVYMLQMDEGGSIYTGWTNDIDARIEAHNTGRGAKYTEAHGQGKLVHLETFDNKSDALKREYAIKQLSRKQKLDLIK